MASRSKSRLVSKPESNRQCPRALWHLASARRWASAKRLGLGAAAVVLLLTLFFLFGGETLERFQHLPTGGNPGEGEFRVRVQRDALKFSTVSPWLGVELGNFETLFPQAREASVEQIAIIHPESDWLWAACEMGWLAPALLIAAFVFWMKKCLPIRSEQGEAVRLAAMVGVVIFLLHGLVDVSGHRIGSAWVALLFAGLALPARETTRGGLAPRLIFPALAIGLAVMATWWFASLRGLDAPPTTSALERLRNRIAAAALENDVTAERNLTTAALQIAPLDWTLYFQRAGAIATNDADDISGLNFEGDI